MKLKILIFLVSLLVVPTRSSVLMIDYNIPDNQADSRYTVHDDGTVTDRRTGLMWKQCAEGLSGKECSSGSAESMDWDTAIEWAKRKSYAGYSDWRLPNVKELNSIVDNSRFVPSINVTIFPNTPPDWFWSSSLNNSNKNLAWFVGFSLGSENYDYRLNFSKVRLVRYSNN